VREVTRLVVERVPRALTWKDLAALAPFAEPEKDKLPTSAG
jgi:hypothetical protein